MKEKRIERRSFLKHTAAIMVGASLQGPSVFAEGQRTGAKLRKALQLGMLPRQLSDADKFKLAKKCGFEGIEGSPMSDFGAARELGRLARQAGVPIHSIVYGGWGAPLSDPDPEVIKKGLAGMETALRSANAMGAEAVLLVPAIVTETVGYAAMRTSARKSTSANCCLWRKNCGWSLRSRTCGTSFC